MSQEQKRREDAAKALIQLKKLPVVFYSDGSTSVHSQPASRKRLREPEPFFIQPEGKRARQQFEIDAMNELDKAAQLQFMGPYSKFNPTGHQPTDEMLKEQINKHIKIEMRLTTIKLDLYKDKAYLYYKNNIHLLPDPLKKSFDALALFERVLDNDVITVGVLEVYPKYKEYKKIFDTLAKDYYPPPPPPPILLSAPGGIPGGFPGLITHRFGEILRKAAKRSSKAAVLKQLTAFGRKNKRYAKNCLFYREYVARISTGTV